MSKLYLVPTPIGNLQDITLRAIDILKKVDYILAEDTRKTGILLKHFEIHSKLKSFHKFNEHRILQGIIHDLENGQIIAMVSDAGTPGISDPGFLLVRECVQSGIEVETLPGATAFVPALINSGLPSDRFVFEGFLPQKKGKRKKIESLLQEERTMIFYESPYRVIKTLELFREIFGDTRKVSVSREISKINEENVRGTIPEVIDYFGNHTLKGEVVIVLEGNSYDK